MKIQRLALVMVGMLLACAGAAFAQSDPEPLTGRDRATEAIEINLARQIAHLEGLLATAPEQALPGIQTAIDSLTAGMGSALEALSVPADATAIQELDATAESGSATTDTGVLRARQAVQSGTDRAQAALVEAMSGSSMQSQAAISDAIARLVAARERVLANLTDSGIAERGIASLPTRPARPDQPVRPDRPERVEAPERPARPERPERPVRPELPERPTPPGG